MQYTDNEAALIGGLISTYFFQPAVSADLLDTWVLENSQPFGSAEDQKK